VPLQATLDPADGLWIAWPKTAGIDGDLTFEAVQEIGSRAGSWTTSRARLTSAGR
jgi:hypothetical protein